MLTLHLEARCLDCDWTDATPKADKAAEKHTKASGHTTTTTARREGDAPLKRAEPKPVIDPAKREAMLTSVRRDCFTEVRGLLGPGLVHDYYSQVAEPFVTIAEHLADEIASGVWA